MEIQTGNKPSLKPYSRRAFLAGSVLGAGFLLLGLESCLRHRWKHIVIHHSAGSFGNVAFLRKVHRQRQPHDPIDAMAYHFVIGNGHGMPLGAIDHGLRWRRRLWGAHVSGHNSAYNLRGIGICLVGNFEAHPVPAGQYQALVRLVRHLMQQHDIRPGQINGHGYLKGEHTLCPGKHFPMAQFIKDLNDKKEPR